MSMHGGDWLFSPFIVPVGAVAAWFGVVAVKTSASYKVRKLESQERIAAMEKGLPLPQSVPESVEPAEPVRHNPRRRGAYLRTGGIVCVSTGIGLMAFFGALAVVLQVRNVLSGCAIGLIPLVIGIGLLIDAGLQSREEPPVQKP
jgi:hypothetical protein